MRSKLFGSLVILSLCIAGTPRSLAGEDDIRQAFGALQKAIKARDGEAVWGLIDSDTQSDANRAAKAVGAAYAKTADKAGFEKKYDLSAKELADMTGKLFLKSKRFYGKYNEVPGSKFDNAKVKGDTARLNYIEEDGDKEKLTLVKQKGQWKFVIPMPRAVE